MGNTDWQIEKDTPLATAGPHWTNPLEAEETSQKGTQSIEAATHHSSVWSAFNVLRSSQEPTAGQSHPSESLFYKYGVLR